MFAEGVHRLLLCGEIPGTYGGEFEGQLNRLKMLKRQMYGRAGIELLRARLLPEPAFSYPQIAPKLRQNRFKCRATAWVRA
jgi:hypothetical protein